MGLFKYPKKMIFLVIFGIVALAILLLTLFSPFTDTNFKISSTIPLGLGTPEFLRAAESVTHSVAIPLDSEIKVFNNGGDFLADLLISIRSATSSVTLTNYIFREGEMTNSTFDALIDKAKQGVEVRLLLDGKGGMKAPEDRLEALKAAGGKVETFRPLNFAHLTRIHRRNHIRAVVVDGHIGYTGGLAFDDEWFGEGKSPHQWRDVMFRFEGRAAQSIQDHFNNLWRQTNGEVLSGPAFYPSVSSSGSINGSYFINLFHSPSPDVAGDLQDLIWLTMRGAKDRILITTPYMTPDKDIRDALMEAARRGVRVEVLMPGPYTDAVLIRAATHAYYDNLLAAGVKIFEYQPGRFHEKTMTADRHWSLVGSANMDNRSATLNIENVMGVEDQKLALDLESEFEESKKDAVEITAETWHPNIFKRIFYNAARLFAKQY